MRGVSKALASTTVWRTNSWGGLGSLIIADAHVYVR